MDCQRRFQRPEGTLVVAARSIDTGFCPRNGADQAAPVLAVSHYLPASRDLISSFVESIHRDVDSRKPWTRAHFQKDDWPSIPIVESAFEESFRTRVVTQE